MGEQSSHDNDGIVARHDPDTQQRLAVPMPVPEKTMLPPEPETQNEAVTLPLPPVPKVQKAPLQKRVKRYVAAFFKLSRIEWRANHALQLAEKGQAELQHLRQDLYGELDQLRNDLQSDLQGALNELRSDLHQALGELGRDVGQVWNSIDKLQNAFDRHGHQFDVMNELLKTSDATAARAISDLGRRLDLVMLHGLPAARDDRNASSDTGPVPSFSYDSEGFRAFKDAFYHRLENRYRGSVAEITNRLRIYLPDVEAAVIRSGGKPAMDIGCGRGEWLALMREVNIKAFGVDTNPVQIEAAQRAGLDVRLGDAVEMLAKAKDSSLSVLTAHHLVEHLPFDMVTMLVREAMRVLAPGGLLLFETPNTRNVLVGATTFHTDPTHIKPMPEQVLGVLFDTAGFDPVEIRHLHPHERLGEFLDKPDFNNELARLMFGPQDLAVLGIRPAGE